VRCRPLIYAGVANASHILCAAIVASLVACSATHVAPAWNRDLTGVWTGSLTLGCVPPRASPHCLIRQDISFTFVPKKVGGAWCAPIETGRFYRRADLLFFIGW
jgi:hypothetical protein